MEIYLHIGSDKCGSSTIQHYFSYNYQIDDFIYGVVKANGVIINGLAVMEAAEQSAANYSASNHLDNGINDDFIINFKESLEVLSKKCNRLLLSQESWSSKHECFHKLKDILKDHDVSIILIVRPPVQWLNSAWWQWFQWRDIDIDSWANNALVAKRWVDRYNNFNSLDFKKTIHVLSLQRNIVAQVGKIIGISVTDDKVVHNSGSSSELLNFFKVKRSLRPGPHNSQPEFVLNKYLKSTSKSDWVLSNGNIANIINNNKEYCLQLAELIQNEDITSNDAWWNEDYYKDKSNFNRNKEVSYDLISSMLEEAYHVIINIDAKLRKCRKLPKLSPETIDHIRDAAIEVEHKNINLSYELMLLAHKSRPGGDFIMKKLEEYSKQINEKRQ